MFEQALGVIKEKTTSVNWKPAKVPWESIPRRRDRLGICVLLPCPSFPASQLTWTRFLPFPSEKSSQSHNISSIVSLSIIHDLSIMMQKSHKSKLRNILQNTTPVPFKIQVHKNQGKTRNYHRLVETKVFRQLKSMWNSGLDCRRKNH